MAVAGDSRLDGNHTVPGVLADWKVTRTRLLVAVGKERRMSEKNSKAGRCLGCGKPMKWRGKIWLFCEHCGRGQTWPTEACHREGGGKGCTN